MTFSFISNACAYTWLSPEIGTMIFGWRLTSLDCQRLVTGQWANTVRLNRGSAFAKIIRASTCQSKRFRVYRRTKLRTVLRLLWLAVFREARK
jgi:hypothetical protein